MYIEVRKGVHGLPQMGLLAQDFLKQQLARNGFTQSKLTPRLLTHHTRSIQFFLMVDDFGIKYVGREHAEHLHQSLEETYEIMTDWGGGIC